MYEMCQFIYYSDKKISRMPALYISPVFLIFWVQFVWCGVGAQIKKYQESRECTPNVHTNVSILGILDIFLSEVHTHTHTTGIIFIKYKRL